MCVLLLLFGLMHQYNIKDNIWWLFLIVLHVVKHFLWYFLVFTQYIYYCDFFCFRPASYFHELPFSRVSALYWYYNNHGLVYFIAAIVYWSTMIVSFYYVSFSTVTEPFFPHKYQICSFVVFLDTMFLQQTKQSITFNFWSLTLSTANKFLS